MSIRIAGVRRSKRESFLKRAGLVLGVSVFHTCFQTLIIFILIKIIRAIGYFLLDLHYMCAKEKERGGVLIEIV